MSAPGVMADWIGVDMPNSIYKFNNSKPCLVDECDGITTAHTARGLCMRHYTNVLRYGNLRHPELFRERSMDLAEVIWLRSEPDPNSDCVWWTGALRKSRYPETVERNGYRVQPQRLSWSLVNGPIPAGLTIDHACHTYDVTCPGGAPCLHRKCINPDHLEVVTKSENSDRMHAHRRAHLAFMASH